MLPYQKQIAAIQSRLPRATLFKSVDQFPDDLPLRLLVTPDLDGVSSPLIRDYIFLSEDGGLTYSQLKWSAKGNRSYHDRYRVGGTATDMKGNTFELLVTESHITMSVPSKSGLSLLEEFRHFVQSDEGKPETVRNFRLLREEVMERVTTHIFVWRDKYIYLDDLHGSTTYQDFRLRFGKPMEMQNVWIQSLHRYADGTTIIQVQNGTLYISANSETVFFYEGKPYPDHQLLDGFIPEGAEMLKVIAPEQWPSVILMLGIE